MFELVMRDLVAAGQWLSIPEASDLASHLRRTRRTCISAMNYPAERDAATGCTGTGEHRGAHGLGMGPSVKYEGRSDGGTWISREHAGHRISMWCCLAQRCTSLDAVQAGER